MKSNIKDLGLSVFNIVQKLEIIIFVKYKCLLIFDYFEQRKVNR